MPSPFPGMDPYLEKPSGGRTCIIELISATRAGTQSADRPQVSSFEIEERIYISNDNDPGRIVLVPDVQVSSRDVGRSHSDAGGDGGTDVAEPLVLETLVDEKIREAYIKVVDAAAQQGCDGHRDPEPR